MLRRIIRRVVEGDIALWLAIVLVITIAYNLWALYETWHMFNYSIPLRSPG